MTLAEWCKATGVLPTHPTTEHAGPDVSNDLIDELWRLSDYCVSSVRGVVIWLVPPECQVCGKPMERRWPSGVCGSDCLLKGQGFPGS